MLRTLTNCFESGFKWSDLSEFRGNDSALLPTAPSWIQPWPLAQNLTLCHSSDSASYCSSQHRIKFCMMFSIQNRILRKRSNTGSDFFGKIFPKKLWQKFLKNDKSKKLSSHFNDFIPVFHFQLTFFYHLFCYQSFIYNFIIMCPLFYF